ncbi:hypothetical protein LIER_24518 [Lithospermum erythrorhizon]|uniref:MULE transposase domain-containing protein n=1 Tax=Lithospermum erythrorhizon TaxID=34254 RepID=A0AAV3R5M5_LITER
MSSKSRRLVKSTWLAKTTKSGELREKTLKAIKGDHTEQYKLIWGYIEELKKSHPGSTVFAEYEDIPEDPNAGLFKRIYENKETWKWFIQALSKDLSIVNEEQYVIMSDKQKGLGSALHELLPRIEHRNCVQHIYKNLKRHHGSQLLRDKPWTCARASTELRYNAAMFDLKETDPAAQTWMETNVGMPKHWCRAFFPLHVKSDMLCNNLSESFNSFILFARDKSIITMLERIRRLCMERIKDKRLAIVLN